MDENKTKGDVKNNRAILPPYVEYVGDGELPLYVDLEPFELIEIISIAKYIRKRDDEFTIKCGGTPKTRDDIEEVKIEVMPSRDKVVHNVGEKYGLEKIVALELLFDKITPLVGKNPEDWLLISTTSKERLNKYPDAITGYIHKLSEIFDIPLEAPPITIRSNEDIIENEEEWDERMRLEIDYEANLIKIGEIFREHTDRKNILTHIEGFAQDFKKIPEEYFLASPYSPEMKKINGELEELFNELWPTTAHDSLPETESDVKLDLIEMHGKLFFSLTSPNLNSYIALYQLHHELRPKVNKEPEDWLFLIPEIDDSAGAKYLSELGNKLEIPVEDPTKEFTTALNEKLTEEKPETELEYAAVVNELDPVLIMDLTIQEIFKKYPDRTNVFSRFGSGVDLKQFTTNKEILKP